MLHVWSNIILKWILICDWQCVWLFFFELSLVGNCLVQHNHKLAYLKWKKEIPKCCCLILFLVYAKCSEKVSFSWINVYALDFYMFRKMVRIISLKHLKLCLLWNVIKNYLLSFLQILTVFCKSKILLT